jgi:hypothetical protein
VINKMLFSTAVALSTAVGVATPAGADPSSFSVLSCSCTQNATADNVVGVDPMNEGIQAGQADLRGISAPLEP